MRSVGIALAPLALCLTLGCGWTEAPHATVLLIGVDAATWDVMRPMMARGELPNVQRLVERGVHGTLLSMDPMVSPALWTTIATGVFPERHGITGFVEMDPATGKRVPDSSNLRRREALWTMVSQRKRTVNVVGWYATWPAEAVSGAMVTDHLLPREMSAFWPVTPEEEARLGGRTYPRELLKALLPLVPTMQEVAAKDHLELRFKADGTPEIAAAAKLFEPHRVDETRVRAARYLMQHAPADLTMVFLWGIDPMSHLFWHFHDPQNWEGEPIPADKMAANKDKIRNYYRKIDGYIGDLVATAGRDTIVVIVSDHGFGPGTGRTAEGLPISGDHRREGILVAAGGPIRRGLRVDGAGIVDVTPTVLYLLGLPVGADMDGRVIEAMFGHPLPRPVESIPSWETGEPKKPGTPIPSPIDEELRQQLRALGYIQ
jgi:predicted AlkP superfamily phosphohydrolase/phosphomutase